MASNIEEEKKQHHATLAAENKRKAEWHEKLSGGSQPSTTNTGSQVGGFIGAISEHKWYVVGAIAAVIVFFLAMKGFSNQGGSANQAPDLSQGNFVPSNISTALDSINAGISGLSQQLAEHDAQLPVTATVPDTTTIPAPTPNPTPNPAPVSLPPVPAPQPQPNYVTVDPWPAPLSTLWGIAQSQGLSLARIEQLNPNLYNQQPGSGFDLIYPGQQVRVS